eukprot:SAG22_NODE_92_length_20892_cov_11.188429_9_plen_237_part_00
MATDFKLTYQAFSDVERPKPALGYFISVGGGLGDITNGGGGGRSLRTSGGEKMMFGCETSKKENYLACTEKVEYWICYQPKKGVNLLRKEMMNEAVAGEPAVSEGGRIKGIYVRVRVPGEELVSNENAGKCRISFTVKKLTRGGTDFGHIDDFDISCSDGGKKWEKTPPDAAEAAPPAGDTYPSAPADWATNPKNGTGKAGGKVAFRGSVGTIRQNNWRYHQICNFMMQNGIGPWE